jgi:hypothetical protein
MLVAVAVEVPPRGQPLVLAVSVAVETVLLIRLVGAMVLQTVAVAVAGAVRVAVMGALEAPVSSSSGIINP